MARRRFELDYGRTSKFWEIQLKDRTYVVRYGKIGSAGQTLEKLFASHTEAKEAMHALVRAKLKKGYREMRRAGGLKPQPMRQARSTIPPPKPKESRSSRRTRLLSEAIYREAEQKGAKVDRTRNLRELPKSVKRCPDLIAEFYQRIVWRKNQEFQVDMDKIDWDGISFYGPIQEANPHVDHVVGCEGKDLFGVGSIGDNWTLLLDGNDKTQSDPTVYVVDHASEPGDELWNWGKLSKFLRSLRESV